MTDTDPITRLNAALEGRYRIESELATGCMSASSWDPKHMQPVGALPAIRL